MESNIYNNYVEGFALHVHSCRFNSGDPKEDTFANPVFRSEVLDEEHQIARALELDEAEEEAFTNSPDAPVDGVGDPVHIGIDSEWDSDLITEEQEPGRQKPKPNLILSYQFYLVCALGVISGLFYPNEPGKRLTFESFLSGILRIAMERGLIDTWPRVAFVYAHFLRADLPNFASFWSTMKRQVDSIQGTVASIKGDYSMDIDMGEAKRYRPKPLCLRDQHRHPRRVHVKFCDTLNRAPGGMGLAGVGELIQVPKVELPIGYEKSDMSRFLAECPEQFAKYAVNDAKITVLFGLSARAFDRSLGLSGFAPTIGMLAVRLYLHLMRQSVESRAAYQAHYERVFGLECAVSETKWDSKRQRPKTYRERRITPHRLVYEEFVKQHYHGGNNQCFLLGPSEVDDWNDIDLQSAYLIGQMWLRVLDYARAYPSRDVADYLGSVCGFALVRFRFPETVRYPCLPVRVGSRGLYFPLSGLSYCTATELSLAVRLGAEIEILQGIVVPWAGDGTERVFEGFVRKIYGDRLEAKAREDEFHDKLIKTVGNSLYGKLAQGMKRATSYDTRRGGRVEHSPSPISNPYMAAAVTGFIRGVVGELLAGIPAERTVISVTTDGFLTNASLAELDCSGPLMQEYRQLLALVSSPVSDDPWAGLECKHRVRQVVSMRTRGTLTAQAREGSPIILAKASVKPPMSGREAQNRYLIDLYLDRRAGQRHEQSHLISLSEQWLRESDLVGIQRNPRLNLEFDFKREPINPRLVAVAGTEHLSCDTRPWKTAEEGLQARALFDGWRQTHTLKTLEDWDDWQVFRMGRQARRARGIRATAEGEVGVLRRTFLRAYSRGVWGTCRTLTNGEMARVLTERGYPTSEGELKNAKRAALSESVVVPTQEVKALWAVLLELQPGLEAGRFFAQIPDDALKGV